MQESQNIINFIKQKENAQLYKSRGIAAPYFDKYTGKWNIGYGTTRYPDGKYVTENDHPITEIQASAYLKYYVDICCNSANEAITAILNQVQFDACICLAYNIGAASFVNSTLLKTINESPCNLATIKVLWLKWDYSKGVEVSGLEDRRKEEYQMYASGFDDPDIMYV